MCFLCFRSRINLKNNANITSKNTFMLGVSNHYLSLPFHELRENSSEFTNKLDVISIPKGIIYDADLF